MGRELSVGRERIPLVFQFVRPTVHARTVRDGPFPDDAGHLGHGECETIGDEDSVGVIDVITVEGQIVNRDAFGSGVGLNRDGNNTPAFGTC